MTHENYRGPGEFGESATVRRAEPSLTKRLRSDAPLPLCPFEKRSPDYWTTPNDEPCKFCGGEPEGPDKCTGADMRILLEAADRIDALEAALRKIAAYDDAAANAYLRATGSYRCFDEPGAVEMARGVLAGGAAPAPATHVAPDEDVVETIARRIYEDAHKGMANIWAWNDRGLDDEHPGTRERYLGYARSAIAATPPPVQHVEAIEIIREMVRLAEMGFDESLKEPEENGNFAAYERAKRFLAACPSPQPREVCE